MIGYIYFKDNLIIINKIYNIEFISDSNKEIRGEDVNGNSLHIIFGDSQDYIIIESDTINLSVGDMVNTTNLVDARDYFLKGKDYWYQEKLKNQEDLINNQSSTINNLDTLLKTTNETMQGFMDFYFEQNPNQA